jgi:hypothetical protein
MFRACGCWLYLLWVAASLVASGLPCRQNHNLWSADFSDSRAASFLSMMWFLMWLRALSLALTHHSQFLPSHWVVYYKVDLKVIRPAAAVVQLSALASPALYTLRWKTQFQHSGGTNWRSSEASLCPTLLIGCKAPWGHQWFSVHKEGKLLKWVQL